MAKPARRAAAFLLTLMILLSATMAAHAAPGHYVTLRVAFYPLEGFFEYDDSGKEIGYGVELLDKVTQVTGIRFTYVPAENWEDTQKMLENDVADVRMPATMPRTVSAVLGYTSHGILDTYYAVMTLADREDLIYEDYDTMRNLTYGVVDRQFAQSEINTFLPEADIGEDQLVFFDTYNECRDALSAGRIDALISNIMDLDEGMKQLARFSSLPSYISMTLGNPFLVQLNDALSRIDLEDPSFMPTLYQKWFPQRTAVPLNKAEITYLNELQGLCFSYRAEEGYLSRQEGEGYVGFYPEMARIICGMLGVTYSETTRGESSDAPAIIYPDFYRDITWAESCGVDMTSAYLTIPYFKMTRKSDAVDEGTCRVAAVRGLRVTEDLLGGRFTEDQLVWCDSYAESIDAVRTGRADMTFVNSYVAEYYLNMYRYSGLTSILTDYSSPVCFAVQGDDSGLLASALDKLLRMVSHDDLNALMVEVTAAKPEQALLAEWIYENPVRSILLVSSTALVILVVATLFVFLCVTRRKNRALVVATNAKQDFLARMSHDMRTPMNAILGFSGFGEEAATLEDSRECHRKIRLAGQYLLQLVNDSLDLSRMTSGKYHLSPEPVQLEELVEAVTNIVEPRAREKGVSFTVTREGQEHTALMFDKGRLEQIFVNLLNNAVKFTPAGGRVGFRIAVAVEGQSAEARFTVADNGIGMSEEFVKKRLFSAFEQEHHSDSAEGTGLGLCIVKQLVDAMGGSITCHSKPGEGTTFLVTLHAPCAAESAVPAAAPDEADEGLLKGRRALLCEDHPLNTEIVVRMLEKRGMTADHAENGQMGLTMFEQSPPGTYDVILMDVRMPVMNGMEATRRIRGLTRPDAQTIPIIAMTANAFEEDVKACLDAGMNAHLAKPVAPATFYEVITQCVKKQDAAKAQ